VPVCSTVCFHLDSPIHTIYSTLRLAGGGCIWNDIVDIDIDAKVERTKNRPLPTGRVSVPEALVFMSVHLVLMVIMLYPLKHVALLLGLLAIGPLPGIYPFMKRITYWPQAWLGIALNVGAPFGSAIFTGEVSKESLVLAIGGWSWTIWYDTIYACQDKKDDVKAGVKSTALLFGAYTKPILFLFGSLLVGSWLYCGIANGSHVCYFVSTVVGGAFLLLKQIWNVDLDTPKSCLETFQNNGLLIGPVVWVGFLADYLMA